MRYWLLILVLVLAACSTAFTTPTPTIEPTPTQEVLVGDLINPGFSLGGQPTTETIKGRTVQTPPKFNYFTRTSPLPPFSLRVQDGGDNDYLWELHNIPETFPDVGEWCYSEEGITVVEAQRYILVVRYDAEFRNPDDVSLVAWVWDTTIGKKWQLQTDGIQNGDGLDNVWAFEIHSSDIPQLRYEVCLQIRFGMDKPADFVWDAIEVRPVSSSYAEDKVLLLE